MLDISIQGVTWKKLLVSAIRRLVLNTGVYPFVIVIGEIVGDAGLRVG
jgi:hypothetical protein